MLQMKDLMHREVQYLAKAYAARRWVLAHQDPAGEGLIVDVLPGARRREEGRGPWDKTSGSGWQGKPRRLSRSRQRVQVMWAKRRSPLPTSL